MNDTIQKKSEADVERISKANLMPAYFKRLQYKTDSVRAMDWFQKTKDSSYLERFTMEEIEPVSPLKREKPGSQKENKKAVAMLPDEKYFRKPRTLKIA